MTVSIETLLVDGDTSVAVARWHPYNDVTPPLQAVATLLFKGEDVYIIGLLSVKHFGIRDVMALAKALNQRGVKQAFFRRNITDPFRPFNIPSWRLH